MAKIRYRWDNDKILFEAEAERTEDLVAKALAAGADLTGADLTRANLTGADLTRANLTRADLTGANLYRADLYGQQIGCFWLVHDLAEVIPVAPLIWDAMDRYGAEAAARRSGALYIPGEERAVVLLAPNLQGGFCLVMTRREIWWYQWTCPNPETVTVLWRGEGV